MPPHEKAARLQAVSEAFLLSRITQCAKFRRARREPAAGSRDPGSGRRPHNCCDLPEVGWCSIQEITVQQISCGAGHRFSWPAEFEHGAQTTNDDRLRHAGHRNCTVNSRTLHWPTGRFATLAEAVESFLATREQTVRFVEACDEDLRAKPMAHPLLGPINCHVALLLIAVHPRRHASQIREIRTTLAGSGGQ